MPHRNQYAFACRRSSFAPTDTPMYRLTPTWAYPHHAFGGVPQPPKPRTAPKHARYTGPYNVLAKMQQVGAPHLLLNTDRPTTYIPAEPLQVPFARALMAT
jgi:hypothetical protein